MGKEEIKRIRELCESLPGTEWVWGTWDILDEDREAQKRKEPYWTLLDSDLNLSFAIGPIGRKSLEPSNILEATGYECEGIYGSPNVMSFISKSRTIIPFLLNHIDALELELVENARLLGISAERELNLLAKIEQLQKRNQIMREALELSKEAIEIVSDWSSAFPDGLEIGGEWMSPDEILEKLKEALKKEKEVV